MKAQQQHIVSIGIDPDVHKCAFAYVTKYPDGRKDLMVHVVRQKDGKRKEAAMSLIQQEEFSRAVIGIPGINIFGDVLTVEGQDVRYTGKTSYANPQDVLYLAMIAGAAINESGAIRKYCPLPREWKATVRKDIKQKRILSSIGIEYDVRGGKSPYPVPRNFQKYAIGKVNAGDWADLTDAVGLALWGLEKYEKEIER